MAITNTDEMGPWQVFTFILSLIAILILAFQTIYPAATRISNSLQYIDTLLSGYNSNKFNWIESPFVNSCSLTS